MMKSTVSVGMAPSSRPAAASDVRLGEDAVDLAHRLAHALLHAHLEHLLELVRGFEGRHGGHPGAALGLLEGHHSPGGSEVAGRLPRLVREAVLELEAPRLVEVDDAPPAP